MKSVKSGFDPLSMLSVPKKKNKEQNSSTPNPSTSQNKIEIKLPNDSSKKEKSNNNSSKNLSFDFEYIKKFYSDKNFIRENSNLLPCENIEIYEKASYRSEDIYTIGILILTRYRLVFKFQDEKRKEKMNYNEEDFSIPLFLIKQINKIDNNGKYIIELNLKDSRNVKYCIWASQNNLKFFGDLNELVFPHDSNNYFLFTYDYNNYNKNKKINGWNLFDVKREFLRMGISSTNNLKFSNVNEKFLVCESYPEIIIIPSRTNDSDLKNYAYYRINNRIPILSYLYKKKDKLSCIWRSSQIKPNMIITSGFQGDNKYIQDIIGKDKKFIIFDIRNFQNNSSYKFNIKNNEFKETYFKTEVLKYELAGINNIRQSVFKLYELCNNNQIMDNKNFYTKLDNTNWYQLIFNILNISCKIKLYLENNISILLHDIEGFDLSCVISSISQILIDPFYRTIKGFAILIEKEFLYFGFNFGIRNGFYLNDFKEDGRSPIFLLFLDCIHQILEKFPNFFEFTNDLLIFLGYENFTNKYGTFIFNNNYERNKYNAKEKTCSIWTDILCNCDKYVNSYYNSENISEILYPNFSLFNLDFWDEYFMRNSEGVKNKEIYSKNIKFNTTQKFFDSVHKRELDKIKKFDNNYQNLKDALNEILDITKLNILDNLDDYDQIYLKKIYEDKKKETIKIKNFENVFGINK